MEFLASRFVYDAQVIDEVIFICGANKSVWKSVYINHKQVKLEIQAKKQEKSIKFPGEFDDI